MTKSPSQWLITTHDRNDWAGTAPFHVWVYLMILNPEETAFLAFGGYGCWPTFCCQICCAFYVIKLSTHTTTFAAALPRGSIGFTWRMVVTFLFQLSGWHSEWFGKFWNNHMSCRIAFTFLPSVSFSRVKCSVHRSSASCLALPISPNCLRPILKMTLDFKLWMTFYYCDY